MNYELSATHLLPSVLLGKTIGDEIQRHFFNGFYLCLLLQPVSRGRLARDPLKKAGERTRAFKTHGIANPCSLHTFSQQLLCFINAPVRQVLMWGHFVNIGEYPYKVVLGKRSFSGDVVKIDVFSKMLVDEKFCINYPPVQVYFRKGFLCAHSVQMLCRTRTFDVLDLDDGVRPVSHVQNYIF